VAVLFAAASHFNVSTPAGTTAGVSAVFTVTVLGAFNNIATGYTGAVHLTSTDGVASCPGDYAFLAATWAFTPSPQHW